MMVARFNLYAQGWILLLSSKEDNKVQHRQLEIATLSIFIAWFTAMLWMCLGSW